MTHSPLTCRWLAVLAATTLATANADAASSSPRRVRAEPGPIKTVAVRQPVLKTPAKAPAPAPQPQPQPTTHGNQDGDRFLYDSCGCSGGQ